MKLSEALKGLAEDHKRAEAAFRRLPHIDKELVRLMPEAFAVADLSRDEDEFWIRAYAFARQQLKLSADEFWDMNPRELVAHVEAWRGGKVETAPKPKADPLPEHPQRLRATVHRPDLVRLMDEYLYCYGVTMAVLAKRAGVTDRTLRRFRDAGRIKAETASILESIVSVRD